MVLRLIGDGAWKKPPRCSLRTPARPQKDDAETEIVRGHLLFHQGDYEGRRGVCAAVLSSQRLAASDAAELRGCGSGQCHGGSDARLCRAALCRWPLPAAPSPRSRRGADSLCRRRAGKSLAALGEDFSEMGELALAALPVRCASRSGEDIVDLARVSTLTIKEIETSGTIALCKWNRLMIVSPRALV